ncbi:MAG: MFS transporter [Candidatus Latescibacteria bacterium]|nr:MFS transporter [Candidatus Latescibacterota bacterium]
MGQEKPLLTRGEVPRALRAFITASGFWGAWGQAVGIGNAVFTGYALYLGADESFISLITAVSYLLALTQLAAPLLGRWIQNKKRLILGFGFGEVLMRGLPAAIPFIYGYFHFAPSLQLGAFMALICLSLLCGYIISPFYSTWVADTIPTDIRARFTSRQTIISTLVAMVAGFAIGQFIDFFPDADKRDGFIIVIAAGSLFGWVGYLTLWRAPFPQTEERGQHHRPSMLLQPFKDTNFRRAVLFYGLWTFATGVGGPLYAVFMLQELHISYTTISIYNALFMVTSILGYQVWGGLVDRFGGKPVLQILMVPATLIPLLWLFNTPQSHYLVPVAFVVSGIVYSGFQVAATPILYELLPEDERRSFYLASWSATVNLIGALGPLATSYLAIALHQVHWDFAGFTLGSLQLIFLISCLLRLLPLGLLPLVRNSKAISSMHLVSQLFRGNLLSYAYNAAVYNLASAEDRRARAAEGLGRSGNPLAIEELVQGLADASPKVRRSAAQALGESGSEKAAAPLVRELMSDDSDIRSEAAEALGRLGMARAIDPLITALEDEDPRVRMSAIRGLSQIGGDEVRELLFWHFSSGFDPRTFSTLVEVLGEMGDYRIIKPTLQHLEDFGSAAVRLQLLNSVCRAVGAESQFYKLLSYEPTRRVAELIKMLKRASSNLATSRALDTEFRQELRRSFERLVQAYETENAEWLVEAVQQIAGVVRDAFASTGQKSYEILPVYLVLLAINFFLESQARADLPEAQEIFLTVCLERMANLIKEIGD